MYKYTPKKQILRDMQVSKVGRWWDTEYAVLGATLVKYKIGTDYFLRSILKRNYPKVCFFSETAVRTVPVNGYLFPVEMFNEEKM